MNRRDRNKQKKKKEREERLRREKHLRQSQPGEQDIPSADHGASPAGRANPITRAKEPASPLVATPGGQPPSSRSTEPGANAGTAAAKQPLDNFFLSETARRWLGKLLAGTDTYTIVQALDPASFVPRELMLKASVCCEMLVAAELVAAAIGRPSHYLPPAVAGWLIERDMLFSPGVVRLAATAVRRVGEFSELRQLQYAAGVGQEWLRGVEALHSRLRR